MTHWDFDFMTFFVHLPAWTRLPVGARRIVAEQVLRPERPTGVEQLSGQLEALEAEDFAERLPEQLARLTERRRLVSKALAGMHRCRVLHSRDLRDLTPYLNEHFSVTELQYLAAGEASQEEDFYFEIEDFSRLIASLDWIRTFLAEDDPSSWEEDYGLPGKPYLPDQRTLELAQAMVRWLMEQSVPVPVRALQERFAEARLDSLATAFQAGLRYLLFYAELREEDCEPVCGVLPRVLDRLRRLPAPEAQALEPLESFHAAFLIDDLTVLMVACAHEPLRLLRGGEDLYAREQQRVESELAAVPEWAARALILEPRHRIRNAMNALLGLGLAANEQASDRLVRLTATPEGLAWLRLPEKERIAGLLEPLRNPATRTRPGRSPFGLLPEGSGFEAGEARIDPAPRLAAAFAALRPGTFVSLEAFLRHQAECRNPLLQGIEEAELAAWFSGGGEGLNEGLTEDRETRWRQVLESFVLGRLVPLGGARLGRLEEGGLAFALTDVGPYLLGLSGDFSLTQLERNAIIVQPNFDIVFLAPSSSVEAAIGRFSERVGQVVGSLFRITKESIWRAASAGMTSEAVRTALREAAAKEVPPNVEQEIEGWFRQCRPLALRRSVLIQCPDARTANDVSLVGGPDVLRLSETVLELRDERRQIELFKKLRDLGILLPLKVQG